MSWEFEGMAGTGKGGAYEMNGGSMNEGDGVDGQGYIMTGRMGYGA